MSGYTDFFRHLDEQPDLPLLTTVERTISRRDAQKRASQYAAVLERAGVKCGDRVLSSLNGQPTTELLLARLGAAFLGVTLIPFQPRRHDGTNIAAKYNSAAATYGAELILRRAAPKDFTTSHSVADGNPTIFHKFSSGTTADPKEFPVTRNDVQLKSQDEITNHDCASGDCHLHLIVSDEDAKLTTDPVSFFTGIVNGVSYGVPPAITMTAVQTLATIEALGARTSGRVQLTMLWGPKRGHWPPKFIDEFNGAATREQLRKVSLVTTAPAITMEQAMALEDKLFDGRYIAQWGMKESALKLFAKPSDPLEKRVNTVGRLSYKNCQFILAGTELCVLSRYVAREFQCRTDAQFDEHGWYHTGDRFALDADGYLTYQGRL